MRQKHRSCASAYHIPGQVPNAEDISRRPLIMKLPPQPESQCDTDRAGHRRAVIHTRRLQRTVRKTLDESRYEKVLDLVDSKPGVGVRLRRGHLSVQDVDCQADPEDEAHFARRRFDFDFATGPLPRSAGEGLERRRSFVLAEDSSPLSRAHTRGALTARCQPWTKPSAADFSI